MRSSALPKAVGAIAPLLLAVPAAAAEGAPAVDPTAGFGRIFGLGGHACKIVDDTGRLTIRTEGTPSPGVTAWLQLSHGGTRANVPMPMELAAALPKLPDCPIGKDHAALEQPGANVHATADVGGANAAEKPVSLHVRICFASPGHATPFCRDVPLTPGVAGVGFDSVAACEGAKARALDDWFNQAKDVFGFTTGWSGRDYQITDPRCVAVWDWKITGEARAYTPARI